VESSRVELSEAESSGVQSGQPAAGASARPAACALFRPTCGAAQGRAAGGAAAATATAGYIIIVIALDAGKRSCQLAKQTHQSQAADAAELADRCAAPRLLRPRGIVVWRRLNYGQTLVNKPDDDSAHSAQISIFRHKLAARSSQLSARSSRPAN